MVMFDNYIDDSLSYKLEIEYVDKDKLIMDMNILRWNPCIQNQYGKLQTSLMSYDLLGKNGSSRGKDE